MGTMRLFRRKDKKIELAAGNGVRQPQSFINFLLSNREVRLAAAQAISYWSRCSSLATAINWIAPHAAAVQVYLYDKVKNVYISDHPALDLLSRPNPAYSYDLLMQAAVAYYLLTGNAYLVLAGNLQQSSSRKAPVSLFVEPSSSVSLQINQADGFVGSYSVMISSNSMDFTRLVVNQRFVYVDKTQSRELYHIRGLSLTPGGFGIIGDSPLNAEYYEIEQLIAGNIHNLSLLKRGATLGGIFKHPDILDQESYDRLSALINQFLAGETNAGRPWLAEGGLDYVPNMMSNKDMDYSNNKTVVEQAIYKAFKLPLPLLSAETMTMANMDAARLDLYRNAVLPVLDRIFAELTNFLLPYYPNSDNLEFRYDESTISALRPEIYANAVQLKDTGAVTYNNIRRMLNYPDMSTGGNELFQPATNVPVAIE